MNVLVIQNNAQTPAALVGDHLVAAGAKLATVLPHNGDALPKSPDGYDAAIILGGLMLGAVGLLLSVYVKQLENFAGTMNFVIFPMFFISPALYPLWKLRESGAELIYILALANPFTYAVELIRYAAYGRFNGEAFLVVATCAVVFFLLAAYGYDPQHGALRRSPQAAVNVG